MRAALVVTTAALVLAGCGRDDAAEQQTGPQASNQVLSGTEAGVTPMAQRIAVIGLLNKRNGIVRNLTMRPGQAVRVKDAVVRLRACETTAPWEGESLTGAFLQLDVEGTDEQWRRVFSGWVYKESPSLNVVEHPLYDVWPKSCAMTFPAGPPPASAPAASSRPSSAQRSAPAPAPAEPAEAEPAEPEPPAAAEPAPAPATAVVNNAT